MELLLLHLISFAMFCFCFICSRFFKISLLISSLLIGRSGEWFLVSTYLWVFQFSSCYWFIVSYHCGQKSYLAWFQSPYICWGLFGDPTRDLPWRMCAHAWECVFSGQNALYASVRSVWSKVWFSVSTINLLLKAQCWNPLRLLYRPFLPSDLLTLLGCCVTDNTCIVIAKSSWWVELSLFYNDLLCFLLLFLS